MRQPVLERILYGVAPSRPQPAFDLLMEVPELVPDLGLGPPGDLLADTRPSRAEAQAHGPDVPVLGGVPVDRVLPAHDACLWRASWEPPYSEWLPFGSTPRLRRPRQALDQPASQRARQDLKPATRCLEGRFKQGVDLHVSRSEVVRDARG